jgi:hypothetical protein
MIIVSVDIGWRHLAYAKLDITLDTFTILEWDVVDIIEDEALNVNKTSVEDLVKVSAANFGDVVAKWSCEVAYLELQPLGQMARNVKTKTLSHIFQAMLLARGIRVEFVSPKLKLAGLDAGSYGQNKKFAVDTAYKFVADSPWKETLDRAKKKDDLADALVQGIYAARAELTPRPAKRKREPKQKVKHHDIASAAAVLDLS